MTTEEGLKPASLMFNWTEYSVFCAMLILSTLIGVYYGWFKKQDTVSKYMMAGKTMGVFPVTMSLVFSHISGVSILGVPAEIYSYGTQYCSIFICIFLVQFIISDLYLPVFFNLQLNSIYEYLELRFNRETRTLASLIFALSLIISTPVVIYVPALAFNELTGVSIHVVSPVISIVCIFYTSLGGLKAVLWTDALQSIFTLSAVICIVVLGLTEFESINDIIHINSEGGRIEPFILNPSPFERNTLWTILFGSIFSWLAQLAVHPGAMQRFIAVPTYKEARQVMLFSTICFSAVKCLTITLGLLLYASYHDCDPVATNMVQKPSQILPLYVMKVASRFPGLTGLFISGIVSAALSTMSAGLNTTCGTLYEDFVQFVGKKQSEAKQNCTMKIMVLVLGLFCAALVLVVERLGALFQMAVSLAGITNGTLAGVFTLGMFFPRANAKGAFWGTITSLLGVTTLVVGTQYYMLKGLLTFPGKATSIDGCPQNLTSSLAFNASARIQTYKGLGSPVMADPTVPLIFKLSYQYYTVSGVIIALTVGLAISYLTEAPPARCQDPKLFSPCVRWLLPQELKSADQYTMVNTYPSPEDLTKENNIVQHEKELPIH